MEKKNKAKFFYDLQNNIYLMKMAFKAYPMRVIGNYLNVWLRYGLFSTIINITFIEKIMEYVENGADFSKVIKLIIIVLILMTAVNVFLSYYGAMIESSGNQIVYEKLHLKMFEKAVEVELECFENPDFYSKYTKAASQIKGRAFNVLSATATLITLSINIIYLTYKAITTDVYVLFFVLLPIIATYIIGIKKNKLQYSRYEANVINDRKKDYVQRTVYLSDFAKELRLTNIFNVLIDVFNDAVSCSVKNIRKFGFKLVLLNGLESGFNYSVTIGLTISYAALRLLYWKNISAADFVVLVTIIMNFTWNVIDIPKNLTKIHDNSQYIENIKSFLEYKPKIAESQEGIIPQGNEKIIKMKNVSYTYPGRKEPVLKNINLEIKTGQKIALVGHNGAGKTTLIKLLMRLYDAENGEITLKDEKGEESIQKYRLKSYRDLFASVFQDYKVLSLTVAENVMMKDVEEGDRKTVERALKDSGVYEKVMSLKNGMDTVLTKEFDKDGAVLSGGEMQKIAIARVFARHKDFVVLDEPSSALDPIAEYKMYESMLKACKDSGVIFISHRMSSAVLADYIYMMDAGEIVEEGTHQQLIEKNGMYAKLFNMQAESYR